MPLVIKDFQQELDEPNLMATLGTNLMQNWRSRLSTDCPEQSAVARESIIRWLSNNNLERFETLNPNQLEIPRMMMEYRYQILRQRYLGLRPEQAYRNLMQRLGSLALLQNKIRTWVALSRDRSSSTLDVLQEVIQDLLQRDRYMQQQITWINEHTSESRLRNALLFASLEEYCLRPIHNQPLIAHRLVNYMRRASRGGLKQAPIGEAIRLVSEDIVRQNSENPVSLLDKQAITQYQDRRAMDEQKALRTVVKKKFERYLEEQMGPLAVQWLQLYLQGKSQQAIADYLNLPTKEVYRLREKISYHAVRVFALKHEPELIESWLQN